MKGLLVDVMGMDCTNGGVTSGKRSAVLIGRGIPEIFEPSEDAPALELVLVSPDGYGKGYVNVARNGREVWRVRAVPLGKSNGRDMFGGHFVWTSDSRFPFSSPIPVFDRFE